MKNFFSYSLIGILVTLGVYYLYPEKKLAASASIDKIVVIKSKHQLLAYSNGVLVKIYPIALGRNPVGDKKYEGDKRTPEGLYSVNDKNLQSRFHKNLGISYPNQEDVVEAKNLGKLPGGDVKIHGIINGFGFVGKFHRWFDWTNGCIRVTNQEIDELYSHTPIGTPIEIRP